MGTRRPADSGRTDSAGRRIKVAEGVTDARSSAPAPAPAASLVEPPPPPTLRDISALADRLEAGEAITTLPLQAIRDMILAAAGRTPPRWTGADLGIPDVELEPYPGVVDGSILCCPNCACMFRPWDDGDTVYPDRFVTAKAPTGGDPIDAGTGSGGECGANPDCACHQAPYQRSTT